MLNPSDIGYVHVCTWGHGKCRAAEGCNAWFWCKEAVGCWEPQSGAAVGFHECILLAVALQPQPLPPPGPPSRDEFSSFVAGYFVDEGACVKAAKEAVAFVICSWTLVTHT